MTFLVSSRVVGSGCSDLRAFEVLWHRMIAQNPRSIAELEIMDASIPPTLPIDSLGANADRVDPSPLTDIQMRMLGTSVQTAKPVRKAAGYAKASGWMTLIAGMADRVSAEHRRVCRSDRVRLCDARRDGDLLLAQEKESPIIAYALTKLDSSDSSGDERSEIG